MPNNPFLNAALALAAQGKPVFPVAPGGKAPITPHGLKDASCDQGIIAGWWTRHSTANLALVTGAQSGVWGLDIDGEEGEASLKELERQHGQLPQTMESITGGGGRHLFFLWPENEIISNSAGKLGKGLDIRGNGGYVVIPPSVHASGKAYAWSVDSAEYPVYAPAWLLELVTVDKQAAKSGQLAEPLIGIISGVAEGKRNQSLARIAGKLLRYESLNPYFVLELCLAWNDARCKPPLSHQEVIKTVDSIAGLEAIRRMKKARRRK